MFTGIVETTAKVIERTEGGLTLARPEAFDDIKIGSSISVSGACLSIIKFDDTVMQFDVVPETFARTKLGELKSGDQVNVERAMKMGERLEGHVVLGHVDCVGVVAERVQEFKGARGQGSIKDSKMPRFQGDDLIIKYPESLRGLIVEKGSVAIDGVSLTVVSVNDDSFSVALIPHTLEQTTLGSLKEGDHVNLEVDVVGRYVLARS